ncbi:MAG: hypothetical protein M3Q89_03250 [Verrucomicrobiota bacterium]|nr:hypothetical protein [Verrucomicrobiota bacterium]
MMNQPNEDKGRAVSISKALEVYERLPGNRGYAVDDTAAQSLGALAAARKEALVARQEADGKSTASHTLREIVPTFVAVAGFVPEMLQLRPPPEPTAPTQWVDSLTGQPALNPWSDPVDVTSQMVIAARDPNLAARLKQTAKGVSYSFLVKALDEAEGRAKLRALVYGETEHKKNPFFRPRTNMLAGAKHRVRTDAELAAATKNLAAASEFTKTNAPEVVAFYRREGETNVSMPWRPKNITTLAQIAKHNPALRMIVTRAEEIDNGWTQRELDRLQEMDRSIAARRAELA